MAETIRAGAYPAETTPVTVSAAALRRISWGAVLAGAVIVIAVHLSLSLLGLGIGLSTVDPAAGDTPEATSFGLGAGIWWVVSNLIALVIGGYVAARLSGMPLRGDGIIHGVLTWAVTLLITIYLLTTGVGTLVGGAFNIVGNAVSTLGQGVAQAAPRALEAAGVSPEQIQQQADELLRPEQPGQLNPDQARSELTDALRQMVTGSEQDAAQARQRATELIAQRAGITPEQANQRIEQMTTEFKRRADEAKAQATQAADATAKAASSASIWAFVAFVLGAAAGALGGAMGTRNRYEPTAAAY
jgi:polyhydroxyalkanoate synthesis regulator phasin